MITSVQFNPQSRLNPLKVLHISAYHVFDINTGRELTDKPLYHSQELLTVALDQYGNTNERCLAFTDKNNDLFLVQIRHSNPLTKLKKLGKFDMKLRTSGSGTVLAGAIFVKFFYLSYGSMEKSDSQSCYPKGADYLSNCQS